MFQAIFDNPPLIALPATHWRKYRKEKRTDRPQFPRQRQTMHSPAGRKRRLFFRIHTSKATRASETKGNPGRRHLGDPERRNQRGRYLGGVEDLLGLLHRVRLLALLEGYRGPHHRQPSAASRRSPPRRGRPGRDPGRHGGCCCSGHTWACSSRARSEVEQMRGDKKFRRGLRRLGLKARPGLPMHRTTSSLYCFFFYPTFVTCNCKRDVWWLGRKFYPKIAFGLGGLWAATSPPY